MSNATISSIPTMVQIVPRLGMVPPCSFSIRELLPNSPNHDRSNPTALRGLRTSPAPIPRSVETTSCSPAPEPS